MKEYEALFIVDAAGDEREKQIISDIQETIKKENGKLLNEENWGKRNLAYPVKKRKEGLYYKVIFSLDPLKIDTLNAAYKLNQDILRVVFIKK